MGKCINHPDRETPYLCMKHQIYLCEACLQCKDPNIYCKHRSACPIWFMSKRRTNGDAEDNAAAGEICSATFLPDRRKGCLPKGRSLQDVGLKTDVHPNAS